MHLLKGFPKFCIKASDISQSKIKVRMKYTE